MTDAPTRRPALSEVDGDLLASTIGAFAAPPYDDPAFAPIRDAAIDLVSEVITYCPANGHRDRALRHVEDVIKWARASTEHRDADEVKSP